VTFGISAGTNINMIDMYEDGFQGHWKSVASGKMFGGQISMSSTGSFERIFLNIGLYYSVVRHKIDMSQERSYKFEVDFLSKNIMFNGSFNYVYPRYKLKPYAGLGLMFFKSMKSSEINTLYYDYYPINICFGPMMEAGVIAEINSR
jgi:hypothetical protein